MNLTPRKTPALILQNTNLVNFHSYLIVKKEYDVLLQIEPYLTRNKSGGMKFGIENCHLLRLYLDSSLPLELAELLLSFTQLEQIFIKSMNLSDSLQFLPSGLSHLSLKSDEITSLEELGLVVNKLTSLSITCSKITTLKGLPELMDSLQSLDLNCSQLLSLDGLPQRLPSLKDLSFENTHISSLGQSLQHSFMLENIYLSNVGVASFHGLPENLQNLKSLFISDSNIESLEGFPQFLPELKIISILNCLTPNIEGLPLSLPCLEKIYIGLASDRGNYEHPLDGYDLIPFHSVQGFPQEAPMLEELSIIGTALNSLEGLAIALPRLNHLIVSYNPLLTSMQGLPRELPNMEWFDMDSNGLRDFQCFPRLPGNPEYLGFRNNPFQSLLGMPEHVLIEKHRSSETDRVFRLPFEFSKFELKTLHASSFAAFVANFARFDLMNAECMDEPNASNFSTILDLTPKGCFLLKKVWDFYIMNNDAIREVTHSMDSEIATLDVPRECTPESFMFFKKIPSLFLRRDYQAYFNRCEAHWNKYGKLWDQWDLDEAVYFAEASVLILLRDETDEYNQIYLNEAFVRELYAYYRLSPMELAQKYVVEHHLSDDERERFLYEKTNVEIKFLLSNLPETDPLLVKLLK